MGSHLAPHLGLLRRSGRGEWPRGPPGRKAQRKDRPSPVARPGKLQAWPSTERRQARAHGAFHGSLWTLGDSIDRRPVAAAPKPVGGRRAVSLKALTALPAPSHPTERFVSSRPAFLTARLH